MISSVTIITAINLKSGVSGFLSSLVKVQQRSEKFDTKPDLLLCKNAFMTKDCVFF